MPCLTREGSQRTIYLVWIAFLLLAALLPRSSTALELRQLSLEYSLFHDSNRFPEMNFEKAKEGMALEIDMDLASLGPVRLFWDNQVHALTTDAQYALVGWHFKLGLSLWDHFQVAYAHHSQHLLDQPALSRGFPVNDGLSVKLVIFSR